MEYLTVSALSRYIKAKYERDPYLKNVVVMGEVSDLAEGRKMNYQRMYLTLKDANTTDTISLVDFHPQNKPYKELVNGQKVVVTGQVSTFTMASRYQLVVKDLEILGVGQLYQKMMENKRLLQEEGIFDFEKKQLPRFCRHIAVLTANSGAVIHDIRKTVEKRYPLTKITLFSTKVQGEQAPQSIIQQIHRVNARQDEFDAVIIGRGGGSFEDLFCYNDPQLIREVANMTLPVVIAVGHESDHPLIEEVADAIASTPTMAAQFLTPDYQELINYLQQVNRHLYQAVTYRYNERQQNLDYLNQHHVFNEPETIINNKEHRLRDMIYYINQKMTHTSQEIATRLTHYQASLSQDYIVQRIRLKQERCNNLSKQLTTKITYKLNEKINAFRVREQQLVLLNPLAILDRGYTYVTKDGKAISSIKEVAHNESLHLHFADGEVEALVSDIKEKK